MLTDNPEEGTAVRLAVYGGAFNPPHWGHIALAKAVMAQLAPDTLLWLPSGNPPHKRFPAGTPGDAQRLALTALAAGEVPGSEVCDIEIAQGLRYTADTLAAVRERYSPDELWLAVGGDMLLTMEQWRFPERVFALAKVAAFAREEGQRAALEEKARWLRVKFGADITVCVHEVRTLSSTEVREALVRGQGEDGLCPAVYDAIATEMLYGVSAAQSLDLELLRRNVRGRLSERRAEHTFGVEEMAARLARRWGADEGEARRAALFHDLTKEEPGRLNYSPEYGILPEEWEALPKAIRHGYSAAAEAERRGASPDIVTAVRYHPTGRPGMGLLEAVLYLADKTERSRPEELRAAGELGMTDLRAGMMESIAIVRGWLDGNGETISPMNAATLRWLEENASPWGLQTDNSEQIHNNR